jgi:hypothetical protein
MTYEDLAEVTGFQGLVVHLWLWQTEFVHAYYSISSVMYPVYLTLCKGNAAMRLLRIGGAFCKYYV